ncbi:hypothetical protein EJ110_NYTH03232 [Nymphaea thermarum]|nr:hypothetical protein EJ110_NYTH03232 [Nymphaea thermarum]
MLSRRPDGRPEAVSDLYAQRTRKLPSITRNVNETEKKEKVKGQKGEFSEKLDISRDYNVHIQGAASGTAPSNRSTAIRAPPFRLPLLLP